MTVRTTHMRIPASFDRMVKSIKMEYLRSGKSPPSSIKIVQKIEGIIKNNPRLKNELYKIK